MSERVLVIGSTMLDAKGRPEAGLVTGTSNPGTIRYSRGGTARNVAENLAMLGADVQLITAVGDDATGAQLLTQTAAAGVNLEFSMIIDGAHTGAYIALLDDRRPTCQSRSMTRGSRSTLPRPTSTICAASFATPT